MQTTLRFTALLFTLCVGPALATDGQPASDATHATSANAAPSNSSSDPAIIERLRERGITAKARGIIGSDLTLWLLRTPDNRGSIIATNKDGMLITGKVYGEDGRLLLDTEASPPLLLDEKERIRQGFLLLRDAPPDTSSANSVQAPLSNTTESSTEKPPIKVGGSVWDNLGQATVIEEGPAGAPLVYIFIDPYCRYCHKQWAMLRAKIDAGQLRVRWVPVAVLSVSQRRLGTVMGLLNDPSPSALNNWMEHQQVQTANNEAVKTALARNTVLFQALRVRSVPALIYKNQAGELVKKAGVTQL